MSFLSALIKVEVRKELDSFLDKQVASLMGVLQSKLSKKSGILELTLKSSGLKIDMTELGLVKDSDMILEIPYEKKVQEVFETTEKSGDPTAGIFESGKLDFVLNGTCELDRISFEKKFMGKGVRVKKVSFDYELTAHFLEKPAAAE